VTAPPDAWGTTIQALADPDLPPALSRGTVDRAAERRGDAGWLAAQWRDRGRVLRLGPDGAAPVSRALRLVLAAADGAEPPPDALFLGLDAEAAYFCLLDPDPVPGGRSLREVGAALDDRDAGLLTTAVALGHWHRTHPRCPRCGSVTEVVAGGWSRRCPLDGSTHFPRTDPAVIVLVTDPPGERAVLGRQPSWPAGRYSCLAGFVEPGESAEQAVVREVAEEAGIACRDVRAVSSQPWPFPASLMLGFSAVADPDAPMAAGDDELEDVRWFSRADVRVGKVLLPPPVSIANLLIARWLRG